MNKLMYILITFIITINAAFADDIFFHSKIENGPYEIYGQLGSKEINNNPSCFTEISYYDGSKFQLIFDLDDDELYMVIRNTSWSFSESQGSVNKLDAIFKKQKEIDTLLFKYKVINSNTIAIRNIIKNGSFLKNFIAYESMNLITPDGKISTITLHGSKTALEEVAKCLRYSQNIDLWYLSP